MNHSPTITEIAKALCAIQPKLKVASKDKTAKVLTKSGGEYKYKYADLPTVWDAELRKLLAENGIAVIQPCGGDGSHVTVNTMLAHISGEWMVDEGVTMIPKDNTPQGIGSCITYARRYGLQSMLGGVSDDDDDGAAASTKPPPPAVKVVANDSGKKTTDMETRLLADCTKGWADWETKRKWASDHKAEKDTLPLDAQARIAAAFIKAAPRAKGLGKQIAAKVIAGNGKAANATIVMSNGPDEEGLAEARAREAEEARAQ